MNFIALKEFCEFVEITFREGSYEQKLYNGLRRGRFRNDREAQKALYGGQKHGASYYSQTKTKLKGRLLDAYYSSGIVTENKGQEKYHKTHQLFCIAEELMARGKTQAGATLMKEALKLSESIGLLSIATLATQKLAFYSGTIGSDPKEFLKYKKAYEGLTKRASVENELRLAYVEVNSYFNTRWRGGKDIFDTANQHLARLSSPIVFEDAKLCQIYYNIKAIGLQAISKWERVIESCDEAIRAILKANPNAPFHLLATFKIMEASSYIQLRKYTKADQMIAEALTRDANVINRQVLNFYLFISKLNQFDFPAAKKIYSENQSEVEGMPEKIIENWRIAWAYYAFMASEPVKVGKLMNELPIYSKDKEGTNFAILVAQVANYLKEGNRGVVIDRMDSLSRYKRRYLKNDPRGSAFVTLLSCLVKGSFDLEKVEALSQPALQCLKSESAISEIEMVPYEVLWEKVLAMLR